MEFKSFNNLFTKTKDGFLLRVKVTPKASHNKIGDVFQDSNQQHVLKISITAAPEDGKANKALIKLLAKEFKLKSSQLSIVSGETSRNKTVLITEEKDFIENKINLFFNK